MRFLLSLIFVVALASVGVGYDWLNRPLEMPVSGVDLSIEPGSNAKDIAASASVPESQLVVINNIIDINELETQLRNWLAKQ